MPGVSLLIAYGPNSAVMAEAAKNVVLQLCIAKRPQKCYNTCSSLSAPAMQCWPKPACHETG